MHTRSTVKHLVLQTWIQKQKIRPTFVTIFWMLLLFAKKRRGAVVWPTWRHCCGLKMDHPHALADPCHFRVVQSAKIMIVMPNTTPFTKICWFLTLRVGPFRASPVSEMRRRWHQKKNLNVSEAGESLTAPMNYVKI